MDVANQVHVESLEALERLASRLTLASSRIDGICDQALRDSQCRLDTANAAFEEAISRMETAASEVSRCLSGVAECEAACESCRGDSDDDDGESCGGADDGLSAAHDALSSAQEMLAHAEENLEVARHNREISMQAHEAISASVFLTRDHLENHLGAGIVFLNRKIEELREYLLTRPELAGDGRAGAANYCRAWLGWCPPSGAVLKQPLLAGRFSLPQAALENLTARWIREDPSLARQIATLRDRHARAETPEEMEAVRMASRRGASGRLGELVAENALRPLARSIEIQRRTTTEDNAHVTITDIVLRRLHLPIHVGKLQIPSGADASIEVKCGKAAYLKQQLTHMERQVAGHHQEQASFCFLSRDFRELDRASKREIARALGKKRSKIYAVLPEKITLDSLVWKQITKSSTIHSPS
jgi:hypothetical protein